MLKNAAYFLFTIEHFHRKMSQLFYESIMKYLPKYKCEPIMKKGTLLELLDKIIKRGLKQVEADMIQ